MTPTDEIGLQARDADRRLVSDAASRTSSWSPTGSRPSRPAGSATGGRRARRPTCLCWRPGSRPTASSRRWRSSAPRAGTLADEWAGVPRAYLGLTVPGFPNMFLIYGPNTNGGTRLGDLHDRVRHRARDRRARRAGSRRARQDRGPAPTAPSASIGSCARRWPDTVWHTGCTNWYVDENGNDPNQWPWLWQQYRRRTATSSPERTSSQPPEQRNRRGVESEMRSAEFRGTWPVRESPIFVRRRRSRPNSFPTRREQLGVE